MKSNKPKCQILHLGSSNATYKYKLGEESSPAASALGVLADSRLSVSQQRALAARRVHQTQHGQTANRGDHPTVFSVV